MEISKPLPPFIEATPTGLVLAQDLTFDEWGAIGRSFGTALQTAAWCIGDWMVYGERKWSKQLLLDGAEFDAKKPDRIPSYVFDAAIQSTSLDRQTLSQYASVCRKIPMPERGASGGAGRIYHSATTGSLLRSHLRNGSNGCRS